MPHHRPRRSAWPRLRQPADRRPLAFHALYFALLAGAWSASWPVAIGLLPLLAFTALQGAVQTHNAVHHPVFHRRWANCAYQVLLTLIYGHPVSAFVPGHTLGHHLHPESARDVMRTSKAQFRPNLLNGLLFFLRVSPDILRGDLAYAQAMARRKPRWCRQLLLEGAALGVVTLPLLWIDLPRTLVFWVAPHLFAQWGIVTINLLQHDGCDPDSRYDHSRNFVGPVLNWLLFNNGFHTIHHMHPGLHWSRTPEAHRTHVAPHIHPGLVQPSLSRYLWRTFVLGRRETLDGRPYHPPAPGADAPWIPDPERTAEHLGAVR